MENKNSETAEYKPFKRYKVLAAFPGDKHQYGLSEGDILMDDGTQAIRNQNGIPIRPARWEDYPKVFQEMEPCGQKEYNEAFQKWLKGN